MNETILYKKTRTGKIQQWRAWVEPRGKSGHPEFWTEFGHADGKKQTTFDVISEGVNIGKANETTALEQACLTLTRKVTKQLEEGYKDTIKSAENVEEICWSERLPKNLCFYKPRSSFTDIYLKSIIDNKSAVFTIKRDGMMAVVRKTETFGVEIYSRRMDLITDKFPHLVEEFKNIDEEFLLLGEIILDDKGADNFNAISQIFRSDVNKAIEKQKQLGKVKYYVFDMPFIKNHEWENLLYRAFLDRVRLFEHRVELHLRKESNISKCEILNYDNDISKDFHDRYNDMTYEQAMLDVENRGLEGLVIWNNNGKISHGEGFVFTGKAYRPGIVAKAKNIYEGDYIVRYDPKNGIGLVGKGKNRESVGSVATYQILDDKEIFLGNCGGGLSDEQRKFYASADFPRVWRILYDSLQPETGALRHPRFNLDRTLTGDKNVNECLMDDRTKRARKAKKL